MAHANVYAALAAVMTDIDGYVKKKKSDKLSYTFAGVDDIIAAVRPALVEHGVIVYPSGVRDLVSAVAANDKGTLMTSVSAIFAFTFAHGDSNTFFVAEVTGEGRDSSDKAHNKALTAAYKYAIKQTLMIETGDGERPQKRRSGGETKETPLKADEFKRGFTKKVEAAEDGIPATTDQARYLASLMTDGYKHVQNVSDKTRLRVLSWLTDREIGSTAQLTSAEVSMLIERFADPQNKALTVRGREELLNLLDATPAQDSPPAEKLTIWTPDSKSAFWEEASRLSVSANQIYQYADVKNAAEFFLKSTPETASELLRELSEEDDQPPLFADAG
jgi:hypothetical protein